MQTRRACRLKSRRFPFQPDVRTHSGNGLKVRTDRIRKPCGGGLLFPTALRPFRPQRGSRKRGSGDSGSPPHSGLCYGANCSIPDKSVRVPRKVFRFAKTTRNPARQSVRNRIERHFPTSYTIRPIPRFCQGNTGKIRCRMPGRRVLFRYDGKILRGLAWKQKNRTAITVRSDFCNYGCFTGRDPETGAGDGVRTRDI